MKLFCYSISPPVHGGLSKTAFKRSNWQCCNKNVGIQLEVFTNTANIRMRKLSTLALQIRIY